MVQHGPARHLFVFSLCSSHMELIAAPEHPHVTGAVSPARISSSGEPPLLPHGPDQNVTFFGKAFLTPSPSYMCYPGTLPLLQHTLLFFCLFTYLSPHRGIFVYILVPSRDNFVIPTSCAWQYPCSVSEMKFYFSKSHLPHPA